jgi:Ala-tRNA(Pro) deacylase
VAPAAARAYARADIDAERRIAMPFSKLEHLLDANHVQYTKIHHAPAYTAQEVAAAAHVPGRELAKTVIVDIDGRLAMVVQSASSKVPLGRVRSVAGARDVHLVSESEFRDRFPDCETGAMPPFGNLYGMEVFVVEDLTGDEEIAFNAGTHSELIRLRYRDFANLVHPTIV